MSKESKPRARWNHLNASTAARPKEYCKGCGYYYLVHGAHRNDCTATDPSTAGPAGAPRQA